MKTWLSSFSRILPLLAVVFAAALAHAADNCACGPSCSCKPTCPCPQLAPPSSSPAPGNPSNPATPAAPYGGSGSNPATPGSSGSTGGSRPRPGVSVPGSETIPRDPADPRLILIGRLPTPPPRDSNPLEKWTNAGPGAAGEVGGSPKTGTGLGGGYTLGAGLKTDLKWDAAYTLDYGPPITPASVPPHNGPRQIELLDGWFEPSQGVWQDDKKFADFAGKQLRKTAPAIRNAELPMIKDRPALIFGIRDDNYTFATIKYRTKMQTAVAVHFRFTLHQPGLPPVVVYEQEKGLCQIYFDPPELPNWSEHEANVAAIDGLPKPGKGPGGGDAFTFPQAGPYIIVAELIRDDPEQATGLKTVVFGNVVETSAPKSQIMPVMLWPHSNPEAKDRAAGNLLAEAEAMKASCELRIPEWYPIKPGGFSLPVRGVRNLGSYVEDYLANPENFKWRQTLGPDANVTGADNGFVPALLGNYFDVLTRLGNLSRTIVVVSKGDFLQQNIFINKNELAEAQGTLAYAACQKVIFAPSDSTADTIAHELVHTLPYLWSKSQMESLFGFSWHNKTMNVANGPQIFESTGGAGYKVVRKRRTADMCIMEAGSANPYWISQGMYYQLADALQQPPDPELVLVSGFISRHRDRYAASIERVYQLMGISDLTAGRIDDASASGGWSILLLDREGQPLARYPFTPDFSHPEEGPDRGTISLSYTVPADERMAEVRVTGPSGLVVSRKLSFAEPEMTVTAPRNGAAVKLDPQGKLAVAWRATGSGGAALRYSVFYSPDGGATWFDQAFEQKENTLTFTPEGGTASPLVRVIASDGSRSRTVTIGFKIAP